MNIKLSVIIPAYNAEKTIKRCLDSIINQTYTNLEIIVIDDGSKDNTFNIINEYMSLDNRIIGIHTENKGVSSARNIGISKATGKYLSFVDSDDYVGKDYFKLLISKMKESNVDLVISGYTLVQSKNHIDVKKINDSISSFADFWNDFALGSEIYGYVWGKLYKREIINENFLLFDITMKSQEDLYFNMSYYDCCNDFAFIDSVDYYYDFVVNKRIVPFIRLIKNQIRLYNLAKKNSSLEDNSSLAIFDRVQNMIYCYLYEGKTIKDINNKIIELKANNIDDFIKKIENKSFICKRIIEENNVVIFYYFSIRKLLGKAKKILKSGD